MSESLAGVTFLAFGNGSPDVFSTFAAFNSHSGSLAIGELIGAACFISAVVSGSMAIVRPFKVARKSFIRDVGFFAVAAGFSMSFLADGRLHLWECAVMVGFYVFYVIFVVSWHWYLKRRRARNLREATARLHFHVPASNQELDVDIPEDEENPVDERDRLLGNGSIDDFAALEAANTPAWKEDEVDEDDEARDRELAELRSQMRVSRPLRGERRNTVTPIRPSLVGALEFRSVLNNLERNRSLHGIPIGLRRYSDTPPVDAPGRSTPGGSTPGGSRPPHHRRPTEDLLSSRHQAKATGVRGRATSANDAHGLRLDTSVLSAQAQRPMDLLPITPEDGNSPILPMPRDQSIPLPEPERRGSSPGGSKTRRFLAPPGEDYQSRSYQLPGNDNVPDSRPTSPHATTPRLVVPSSPRSPRSPLAVSPTISFPSYMDSPLSVSRAPSIHLPPPSMSPDTVTTSTYPVDLDDGSQEFRTFKWWPYKYLPPPQTIVSTLFPTLYHWHGKSIYDKLLGVITAPSVFLLTVTLPVVEMAESQSPPDPDPGLLSSQGESRPRNATLAQLPPESPDPSMVSDADQAPKPQISVADDPVVSSPKDWNRWLVFVQLFTAPFFVVLIAWANTAEPPFSGHVLLRMVLFSLLFSLVGLAILITYTNSEHAPRFRPLLCFLGFLVAIAWIATIANEVVGVLKAFGVILGISDAILGLTIFAVGNSLGDLVADITVARLGYPMMALSACFGGPMLNILLGIGVSGLYMTIKRGTAKHHKHPDRPIKYKPFFIDVSTTLIISGVTLLVTLLGLLIFVPLNGWRMDKKIGIALIVVWTLSTIANVAVEVSGVAGDTVLAF